LIIDFIFLFQPLAMKIHSYATLKQDVSTTITVENTIVSAMLDSMEMDMSAMKLVRNK
jgi:hypothetical protein